MSSHNTSLGHIGDTYVKFAKQFYNTEPNDLTPLLDYLPDLKLDSKYVLDDFRPSEQTNSVLWLYIRDKTIERPTDENYVNQKRNLYYVFNGNKNKCYIKRSIKIAGIPIFRYKKRVKPINPFSHIYLPFIEEAIWQAYLLQQTYHIIGMRWHGGYAERLFINLPGDIERIKEIHNVACCESNDNLEELTEACRNSFSLPQVKLLENKAIITHCWFDAWNGLIQITCQGEYNKRKKQMGEFTIIAEKTLVQYNCKIKY
ncbi:hypothetical protein [Mediterranea massiliensis]|uniref:hypothetical protein n=1 Tax=Mediterranea massiliensis TaxID=1841865 RepID=UPI0023F15261|nr:hypothetical protein [Mediterranea massiliensis]